MKVRWLPLARRDYARAFDWYFVQNPLAAQQLDDERLQVLTLIREAPERWPLWRQPVLRYYTLQRFPYRLFYRCDGDPLTVVAFVHQRRHPARSP